MRCSTPQGKVAGVPPPSTRLRSLEARVSDRCRLSLGDCPPRLRSHPPGATAVPRISFELTVSIRHRSLPKPLSFTELEIRQSLCVRALPEWEVGRRTRSFFTSHGRATPVPRCRSCPLTAAHVRCR